MLSLEKIRELLEDRNLREVSRRSGVGYNNLHGIFKGTRINPSYLVLKALSDYLEVKQKEPVKVNHEGHLFTFGESTIEVEYIGVDPAFPFDRVNKGDK
jgi:hypothetical protein